MTKTAIHAEMLSILDKKIESIEAAIASIEESRNNETKSSAGDKYETGRAMAQRDYEQAKGQLNQTLFLKSTLTTISLSPQTKATLGSLVHTSNGIFFLSIPLGRVKIEDKTVYALSTEAPIGKLMLGKQKGDVVVFNGKKMELLEVV